MTPSKAVMRALDAAGIPNCHWKSNEHLDAALAGETDLDLLVDPELRSDALEVIAGAGFRVFPSSWSRRYPGIEDHLALDVASMRLHHLHLHFALDAGEPHLKSYRLPWVREVLDTRVLHTRHGVSVTAPDLEAVMLLTRATMKLSLSDRLRHRGLSAHDRKELDWLLERTSPGAIGERAGSLLGVDARPSMLALVRGRGHRELIALRDLVRRRLSPHRRHHPAVAPVLGLVRTATWAASGLARRVLDRPVRFARQAPNGGLIVAVVGPDGAGKSTLVATLLSTLRRDVDTMAAYMGSGGGTTSLLRKPVLMLQRRRRPTAPEFSRGERIRRPTPALVLWASLVAREKRKFLRRLLTARRRGLVVVADRWPQVTALGHSDAPLLGAWSAEAGLRGRLAAWEMESYERAVVRGPDIVLRLNVSAAVAASRRPDHDPVDLRRRIQLIGSLEFPASRRVVELDADASADEVAASALEAVWAEL